LLVLVGYSGKLKLLKWKVGYGFGVYRRCGEEREGAIMAWVVDIQ
jgi:hypothetical protein